MSTNEKPNLGLITHVPTQKELDTANKIEAEHQEGDALSAEQLNSMVVAQGYDAPIGAAGLPWTLPGFEAQAPASPVAERPEYVAEPGEESLDAEGWKRIVALAKDEKGNRL